MDIRTPVDTPPCDRCGENQSKYGSLECVEPFMMCLKCVGCRKERYEMPLSDFQQLLNTNTIQDIDWWKKREIVSPIPPIPHQSFFMRVIREILGQR